MNSAELLIQDYGGPFREQALELAQNVITLQMKIDESRADIEAEPLYVVEKVGQPPHDVKRENKAWISFRAQVKAHHDALMRLNDLIGAAYTVADTQADPLDELINEMRNERPA